MNVLTSPVYGEQRHLASTLSGHDCALVLSYSGSTEQTLKSARVLNEKTARSLVILLLAISGIMLIVNNLPTG